MKGLFLAVEGGDGAGKSSQMALLKDSLQRAGKKVRGIHFPRIDAKPYGPMIAEYLRGDYGPLDAVHPKLSALLYAQDRGQAAPELKAALAAGETILADRYFFSNIAYQCAKIDDPEKREKLADWIERLEYANLGIPRPDLSLYLDVPPQFARAALSRDRNTPERSYLAGRRDIHETSEKLQQRVREEFLRIAKARPGEIGVVDCRNPDGGMADKKTVHSRILDALRYYGIQ